MQRQVKVWCQKGRQTCLSYLYLNTPSFRAHQQRGQAELRRSSEDTCAQEAHRSGNERHTRMICVRMVPEEGHVTPSTKSTLKVQVVNNQSRPPAWAAHGCVDVEVGELSPAVGDQRLGFGHRIETSVTWVDEVILVVLHSHHAGAKAMYISRRVGR